MLNHLDHIQRTIPITPRPGECGSRNHPDDRLCERCTDVIFDNSLSATTTGYSPFLSSPPTSTTMDPGTVAYVANVAVVTEATVAERTAVAEVVQLITGFYGLHPTYSEGNPPCLTTLSPPAHHSNEPALPADMNYSVPKSLPEVSQHPMQIYWRAAMFQERNASIRHAVFQATSQAHNAPWPRQQFPPFLDGTNTSSGTHLQFIHQQFGIASDDQPQAMRRTKPGGGHFQYAYGQTHDLILYWDLYGTLPAPMLAATNFYPLTYIHDRIGLSPDVHCNRRYHGLPPTTQNHH